MLESFGAELGTHRESREGSAGRVTREALVQRKVLHTFSALKSFSKVYA